MFGSHLSIAGSMCNALREGEALGLDTVQVFTKNQQQWKSPALSEEAVSAWRAEVARLGWEGRIVSHASYLANLASPDGALWEKSVEMMVEEVSRCEALGISYLVHHPGSTTGGERGAGIEAIARAYREILGRFPEGRTVLCLENTTGSGSHLGREFEELARLRGRIVEMTGSADRVGFCFDTCHAHAGGYDLSSRSKAEGVLEAFDRVCGVSNLRVVHLNDSKGKLGSKLDRHEHIGDGELTPGTLKDSGFAGVVNRQELRDVPMILETPKGTSEDGKSYDAVNLSRLRRLMDRPGRSIPSGSRGRASRG